MTVLVLHFRIKYKAYWLMESQKLSLCSVQYVVIIEQESNND